MTTPAQSWERMLVGNARFVAGEPFGGDTSPRRRSELRGGQDPFALVLGCSDSRATPEIVFDQGLGELFVVRTAGHVADAGVLGSVEYGVGVLGVPLVVVLGHGGCGAVGATTDVLDGGEMPEGWVRDVVERVTPSVLGARRRHGGSADPAQVLAEHVRQGADQLVRRSAVLAGAVAAGRCAVVGAVYALEEGSVRVVEVVGDVGVPDGGRPTPR